MRPPNLSDWLSRTRSILVLSAISLALLASFAIYLGTAIGLSIIRSNADGRAAAAGVLYFLGAIAGPFLLGIQLARSPQYGVLRAIRSASAASLCVHCLLLPVALASLSM